MANYYETLGLSPSATANEIDQACEQRYLQYKSLVTHHDPNTAAQASQAIQQIEKMRTTLTDPAKRSVYDEAAGVAGSTGGLIDLSLLNTAVSPPVMTPIMTPPPPAPVTPFASAVAAPAQPGLWACPNKGCGAENPAHTSFCLKCGTQLVQDCPNCGKHSSLIATGRCGECGFSYEAATQRVALRKREAQLGTEIEQLRHNKNTLMEQKQTAKAGFVVLILLTATAAFCVLIGIIGWFAAVGYIFQDGLGAVGNVFGVTILDIFLVAVTIGLWWATTKASPSGRFDSQIQDADDQIARAQDEIKRTHASFEQLARER